MREGTRQVNNPERVPGTLTAIDGPQAGARRVIHPVALLVGTDIPEDTMYRSSQPEFFAVPEDGTYIDHRGSPIAFKKGDRIPLSRAAQFKAFRVDLSGKHLSGLSPARAETTVTAPAAEGTVIPVGETVLVDPDALRRALDAGSIQLAEIEAVVAERKEADDVSTRKEGAPENRMEPAPQTPERGAQAPENRSGTGDEKASKPAAKKTAKQDDE